MASADHHGQQQQPKQDNTKTQATFLTKLYALLEKPENHHMIRWDNNGDHIIVERPEQLAQQVLPSVYRQSRFASFSRQLNIYGFMRKVNLRNVDPAIDDPDASTWSHPTLTRTSPPEMVANFKRRVPPRLPKPRKRSDAELGMGGGPRSAVGMGPVPLTIPPSIQGGAMKGRSRGFSAPGSFTPLTTGGAPGWAASYQRPNLPPLTVPEGSGHVYSHSPHSMHAMTPTDDGTPASATFGHMPYSNSHSHIPSQYSGSYENQAWNNFSPSTSGSSVHSNSLSSILNPSSNGGSYPQRPTINTYPPNSYSQVPMQTHSPLSPDSRPTTGYSVSSVQYEEPNGNHMDYRPGSSHRPMSPRPPSSSNKSPYSGSLSIRRQRRHSQAMSPYPSPYDNAADVHGDQGQHHQRPSTSPQPGDGQHTAMGRSRSMIQLPSVDGYTAFNPAHAEFAYSAGPGGVGSSASIDSEGGPGGVSGGWAAQAGGRSIRPSTSASSLSAASHTSSSQANTPPVSENYNGDSNINRFSPDFGFVPLNEHIAPAYHKTGVEA